MATRNMTDWQTSICKVVSTDTEEKIIVRDHDLDDLIEELSFSAMMFLMLQGRKPDANQTKTLDALLVACMEHGIAPPSMISRCYASYGTTIQAAIGAGINAFGDRMGGLGEQLARMMTEALADLPKEQEPEDAELQRRADQLVATEMAAGRRVPGYGIPLHDEDPRSIRVLKVARKQGTFLRYCRFAEAISASLARARGGRAVPMNVDGVSAAVALDLGFDWRSTRMFLLTPRSVSMGAHFLEEQDQDSTWRHIPGDSIDYEGNAD